MHRYRARVAKSYWEEGPFDWFEEPRPESLTVYEEDAGIESTGLVDARGVEIVREHIRRPIGFCR